jgi:hypothetical protein
MTPELILKCWNEMQHQEAVKNRSTQDRQEGASQY